MSTIRKFAKQTLYTVNKNPASKYLYKRNISNRSKLKLTDIVPLSRHINLFSPYTKEIHHPNDWYGHASVFKEFLGLPQDYKMKFTIEHGFYVTDEVSGAEAESSLPAFVTYSKYRKGVLKKYKVKAYSVGPFIHYAKQYLSKNEIKKEIMRLGKSLLVIPMHSSFHVNVQYDIENLCKQIKDFSKKYNSTRICLYWADVIKGHHEIYQKYGFECVTAGHMLDPNFLPRLKSIISLSTATISNDASMHVGYCIYLDKPHTIIGVDAKIKTEKKLKKIIDTYQSSDAYNRLLTTFSNCRENITPEQKRIVNKYWGVDQIKTKNQFSKIITDTEKLFYQKANPRQS